MKIIVFIKYTGGIEETGAESLFDVLKSNTTLTGLCLSGRDKKKHSANDIDRRVFSSNQQGTLGISEQNYCVKHCW